jgi:hypothetical protein
MLHLAGGYVEEFGRAIYAELLRRGVVGMPDIHGVLAETAVNLKDPKLADKLPRGYGQRFAEKIWNQMRLHFGQHADVEDLLEDYLDRVLGQGALDGLEHGCALPRAEAYVFRSVINSGINMVKHRGYGDLVPSGEEEEALEKLDVDLEDPRSLREMERSVPPWQQAALKRELVQVHPDAPLYLDLLMRGYNDAEIFGPQPQRPYMSVKNRLDLPSMLPHVTEHPIPYVNWVRAIRPKILKTLRKHIAPEGVKTSGV